MCGRVEQSGMLTWSSTAKGEVDGVGIVECRKGREKGADQQVQQERCLS